MRALSVASAIRRAVSAGEYAPGEKLNEVATAERFGVSRNTLRESFALLDADGIIDRIPNRGVFIARPTPQSVRDLYRARSIIEPGSLLWGPELDVGALDAVVTEAETALAADDLATTGLANQEFHRAVLQSAGSALLDEEMDRMLARMRLVFLIAERADPGFHRAFVSVNREVVDLISSADRGRAAERLRESITATARQLEYLLSAFHSI